MIFNKIINVQKALVIIIKNTIFVKIQKKQEILCERKKYNIATPKIFDCSEFHRKIEITWRPRFLYRVQTKFFFFFFIVCTRYYLQPENFSKNFHPLKKGIWYRAKQGKKFFFEFFSWFFRGFNTMVLSLKNKYFFGFSTGTNCKIDVYLI